MSAVITVTETASCWTTGRNVFVCRAFPIRCCAGGSRRLSSRWTRPFILKSWSEAGRGVAGSVGNCFLRGVPTAFIVRPAPRNANARVRSCGRGNTGAMRRKSKSSKPRKIRAFFPCGRGSRVLIPFPPETAFTFSTKAIEWLAIRPCLWYAGQEKIKDRSGRDGRSERFTGHNNYPGRRCR